jgi:hypothetical protein
MTTLPLIGPLDIGRNDFGIVAYAKTTPNGKITTYVSITTKSSICSSFYVQI